MAASRDSAVDARRRIVFLVEMPTTDRALLAEIRNRVEDTNDEVLVVALLDDSFLPWRWGRARRARGAANRSIDVALAILGADGILSDGVVLAGDPVVALDKAVRSFPADELVIATRSPDRSKWVRRGVVERARLEQSVPLEHVTLE